jgi:hypothetical protein
VMGFVRWESGRPAAKAAVFMQNTYNFRKYVREVKTDEHGFFRLGSVPGDEPYFVFAVPPDEGTAMRSFEYFTVGSLQRELWLALELHPHRVIGTLDNLPRMSDGGATRERKDWSESRGNVPLQLLRIEGKSETIVWSFSAESSGKFAIANVPHGLYRVRLSRAEGQAVIHSLPFGVGDGQSETAVQWPPP